jgi:NAD(P)-dependent dehydrogenase (short-subunit alcohol dehydrogenase family)
VSAPSVVVVTGGSGAIGAAIARSRAAKGDTVVALDAAVTDAPADAVAGWDAIRCDVTDERSVADAVEQVVARHGRIDHVVAAAGVMSVLPIADLGAEEWHRVFDVNLLGLMLTCRYALERMQRGGSISIISSAAGVNAATVTGVAYAVSKAAGIHLARMLAAQYAPEGIRINAVCPGAVDTSMAAVFDRERLMAAVASNPSGRMLGPEHVADVVDFLIDSGDADVTGQVITMGSPPR